MKQINSLCHLPDNAHVDELRVNGGHQLQGGEVDLQVTLAILEGHCVYLLLLWSIPCGMRLDASLVRSAA